MLVISKGTEFKYRTTNTGIPGLNTEKSRLRFVSINIEKDVVARKKRSC